MPTNQSDPVLLLIENYKKHISITRLEDEKYKWELVNEFKGRPNTNAPDFTEEIKSIKFKNLIYNLGIGVINHIAREKPEKLRKLFKYLFDESRDLSERINYFHEETLKLFRELNQIHFHHQDERTIATYLAYHNPQRYTFYKSSFYKAYCKLIGVNEAAKNDKLVNYLELINELIEKYIIPDVELITQVKSYIPKYYDGTNHLILAQDILFQMLENKEEKRYWIFQGNPKIYDIVSSLQDNALTTWSIKAHEDKIKIGDKVILWVTGKEPGCYALAEVDSEIYEGLDEKEQKKYYTENSKDEIGKRVKIKVTHNLSTNPITKEQIDNIPELAQLKIGNQGTNFSATEEQFETLVDILGSNNNNSYAAVKRVLDKEKQKNFMAILRTFIKNNNLNANDERLSFNVRKNKNRLVFIIGNRYVLSISKLNNKTEFSFISKEILSVKSGDFKNPNGSVEAYWNVVDNIEGYENNINEGLLAELGRSNKCAFRKYTNQDFINDVYQIENTMTFENIQHTFSLNTILYGPPGTGKTYKTILRAAEILENRKIENFEEAKRIFKDNLHGQIEFITFHQNYSYEDFIQGLRPDVENKGNLSFERKDGIFKKIAERALNNIKDSEKVPEEISKSMAFANALEALKDRVSESEKPIKINETAYFIAAEDDAFRYTGENWTLNDKGFNGFRMKYSDLIKFFDSNVQSRKDIKQLNNISGLAKQHASYFIKAFEIVKGLVSENTPIIKKIEKKNFVLIIDEINRANISRVFGELITLIEPDKRSHGAIPLKCTLPSGEDFIVPSNLYIIGTMNTADKSIALLDIALRRRFEFEPMYPDYTIDGIRDLDVLKKINAEIIKLKGYDFQIGHSYFMESKEDPYNLVKRMNKKVIPLLLEYFMNNKEEVEKIIKLAGLNLNNGSWPIEISE